MEQLGLNLAPKRDISITSSGFTCYATMLPISILIFERKKWETTCMNQVLYLQYLIKWLLILPFYTWETDCQMLLGNQLKSARDAWLKLTYKPKLYHYQPMALFIHFTFYCIIDNSWGIIRPDFPCTCAHVLCVSQTHNSILPNSSLGFLSCLFPSLSLDGCRVI